MKPVFVWTMAGVAKRGPTAWSRARRSCIYHQRRRDGSTPRPSTPMGILQYRIAKAIDVPPRRINEIVHGKRGISADTALRLSRALGLSDMFFINMQAHYDAETARERLARELSTIDRIA
jgi:addiction module HigA family antidote